MYVLQSVSRPKQRRSSKPATNSNTVYSIQYTVYIITLAMCDNRTYIYICTINTTVKKSKCCCTVARDAAAAAAAAAPVGR